MSQDQSLALRPSEASYCTFDQCSDGTWEEQGRNTAVPFELNLERIETQRKVGDIPGRVHRGVEVLGIVNGCGRWQEHRGEGRARARSLMVVFRLLDAESSELDK